MTENPSALDKEASPAKSLFFGTIEETNLFPYPEISDSEKETIQMVLDSIDKFMSGKDKQYREFDTNAEQPAEYIQHLRELGLFGLIIPEEYGGIGLSNTGYSRVLQQVTRHDGSTSLTVGAHSSIGMKGLLLFGNPSQKERYLPKLSTGEMIAAFCLTEPGSGSDAASIKTNATKQSDGSWILNGEKLWITNGPIADFFTVFAKTDSPAGKISAFIVERGMGVSNGPHEDKLGIRASATSTVSFNNVHVPAENLLGEEGRGFKVAMAILNNGRTGLGGGCVGAMKRAIALAVQQSKDRKQFGKSISEFHLVKEKLAQMTIQCFASESVVSMVSSYIDSGVEDYSVEAAISKIFVSESLWQVANDALQIAGGNGYMKEFPYERIVRDSRINLIFEGTNEILRLYVALSGMNEVGQYLRGLRKGVGVNNLFKDPIKGFGILSEYAQKRFTEVTKIGRARLTQVHPALRAESELLEKYTLSLADVANKTAQKHGDKLIGAQLVTKRLADITIDIFVCLCVLSRVSSMVLENGEQKASDEIKIAKLFMQQAKRRISLNLRRFIRNEDEQIVELANSTLGASGYRWDTI